MMMCSDNFSGVAQGYRRKFFNTLFFPRESSCFYHLEGILFPFEQLLLFFMGLVFLEKITQNIYDPVKAFKILIRLNFVVRILLAGANPLLTLDNELETRFFRNYQTTLPQFVEQLVDSPLIFVDSPLIFFSRRTVKIKAELSIKKIDKVRGIRLYVYKWAETETRLCLLYMCASV